MIAADVLRTPQNRDVGLPRTTMTEISIELLTEADDPTLQGLALLEITAWGGRPDP